MLGIILQSLEQLLNSQNRTLTVKDRIELFKDKVEGAEGVVSFSRKDYLLNFKEIKQATASRDLKWAVDENILLKIGENRMTKYKYL